MTGRNEPRAAETPERSGDTRWLVLVGFADLLIALFAHHAREARETGEGVAAP